MTLDVLLVTVGVLGLVIAALSEKVRRMPMSEPLLALLAGVLLGDAVLGVLPIPSLTTDHTTLHIGAELLLAVSVMAVALRYPLRDVRRRLGPVTLLLVVAMPVMAVVSTGLGWLVLGVPLATAALLGAAMAATDPVLASSILTGDVAEADIPARDREVLSLESGANDGLALPLVLVALAMASPMTGAAAVGESLWQVLGAVVVGAALGWLGGRALRLGEEHGATAHAPALFYTIVLALAILGVAGLLRTDAILAVFVGGLAFNHVSTGADRTAEVSIDEAVNRFAVLPLFVVLGAALPWQAWADLGWRGPALAAAILLLRRLPVLFLLARPLRLRWHEAAYLGWFGPIGVTTLFYLTLEAERIHVPEVVLAA
ncbi:cation:proton antiporter, partial [Nocardioides sp.]|uniref:cation:proton antiporter domain-containing protein n=1 Tax=Nocardioides sp. TaxID=35761 RepID=UPI0027376C7D